MEAKKAENKSRSPVCRTFVIAGLRKKRITKATSYTDRSNSAVLWMLTVTVAADRSNIAETSDRLIKSRKSRLILVCGSAVFNPAVAR